MTDEKVRENRLRREADRQGLKLVKSRRRDERAIDYGAFWLVDSFTNTIEFGHSDFGLNIDEVESLLSDPEALRKRANEIHATARAVAIEYHSR